MLSLFLCILFTLWYMNVSWFIAITAFYVNKLNNKSLSNSQKFNVYINSFVWPVMIPIFSIMAITFHKEIKDE